MRVRAQSGRAAPAQGVGEHRGWGPVVSGPCPHCWVPGAGFPSAGVPGAGSLLMDLLPLQVLDVPRAAGAAGHGASRAAGSAGQDRARGPGRCPPCCPGPGGSSWRCPGMWPYPCPRRGGDSRPTRCYVYGEGAPAQAGAIAAPVVPCPGHRLHRAAAGNKGLQRGCASGDGARAGGRCGDGGPCRVMLWGRGRGYGRMVVPAVPLACSCGERGRVPPSHPPVISRCPMSAPRVAKAGPVTPPEPPMPTSTIRSHTWCSPGGPTARGYQN